MEACEAGIQLLGSRNVEVRRSVQPPAGASLGGNPQPDGTEPCRYKAGDNRELPFNFAPQL
jgi:hypothetical protein